MEYLEAQIHKISKYVRVKLAGMWIYEFVCMNMQCFLIKDVLNTI